jgi:hypothetical protein
MTKSTFKFAGGVTQLNKAMIVIVTHSQAVILNVTHDRVCYNQRVQMRIRQGQSPRDFLTWSFLLSSPPGVV